MTVDLNANPGPEHVLLVKFPPGSFPTSKEAENATHTALTDMAKALGVLGPQVRMQPRSNSRSGPEDPFTDIREADTLSEAVYMALGAASVCWDNPGGGTGVFNSTRAKEIGEALLDRIDRPVDQPPFGEGEGTFQ